MPHGTRTKYLRQLCFPRLKFHFSAVKAWLIYLAYFPKLSCLCSVMILRSEAVVIRVGVKQGGGRKP
jgi:hypothetical protein